MAKRRRKNHGQIAGNNIYMIYRAINHSDGNVLEVQMFLFTVPPHVRYYFFSFFHFRYQQVYFQCRCVAVFPTQRKHLYTLEKNLLCVEATQIFGSRAETSIIVAGVFSEAEKDQIAKNQ